GQYRAGLGQSVTISDGNPQIVEKLQSRRVHECAPGEHRQQLSTENFVDLRQQFAAKRHVRSFTSEELIDQNQTIEQKTLDRRQCVEIAFDSSLKVLEDHGHQTHVSDLVPNKRVANELGPQSTKMHYAGSADERSDKADHKIDGVICGQNAQIADSRPEGIPSSQRLALLQVIFMRQYAALWTASGT